MTTDVEQPSSEQTRVERLVSQPLPLDSIVCGDNVAVMSGFPDACVDLVVTSPPYDNLRTYGGHSWDFEGVAQQLWRVIKPGGVVVWVVADATIDGSETGTSFRQALRFMELGFRLHDTMIWSKPNAMPQVDTSRFAQSFEYMFVLSNGKPSSASPVQVPTKQAGKVIHRYSRNEQNANKQFRTDKTKPERISLNVLEYELGYASFGHPAIFPEALARDHILSWSNEGDIVLDPFSGSGTTAKMARLMGRRFIGVEVNPEYCEIARKRLAQKLLDFDAAG